MRVALGCDHRGLKTKQAVMELLQELNHAYQDFGCYSTEPVDYPDIAPEVARAVTSGSFDQGILICSTGIGMSIAANKIKGVRAALCHDIFTAQRARQHNDANILCLGAEDTDANLILEIVTTYLATNFEGGRHIQRLNKIKGLETNPW
jgi:ribose 5-phosphate isomerase B